MVQRERAKGKVFPPACDVFTAYNLTPFDDVKVVIIGQDPYHGEGQGHGLAFSVRRGIKTPPSLRNIYKEALSTKVSDGCRCNRAGALRRILAFKPL